MPHTTLNAHLRACMASKLISCLRAQVQGVD